MQELGSKFEVKEQRFFCPIAVPRLYGTLAPALGRLAFPVCPGPRGLLGRELSVLKTGQPWARWGDWSPYLACSRHWHGALNFLSPFLLVTSFDYQSHMWRGGVTESCVTV